jgi:hypothetical protein
MAAGRLTGGILSPWSRDDQPFRTLSRDQRLVGGELDRRDGGRLRLRLDHALPGDCRSCTPDKDKPFVIDGEAVLLGVEGISDFDGLYVGKRHALPQVQSVHRRRTAAAADRI